MTTQTADERYQAAGERRETMTDPFESEESSDGSLSAKLERLDEIPPLELVALVEAGRKLPKVEAQRDALQDALLKAIDFMPFDMAKRLQRDTNVAACAIDAFQAQRKREAGK